MVQTPRNQRTQVAGPIEHALCISVNLSKKPNVNKGKILAQPLMEKEKGDEEPRQLKAKSAEKNKVEDLRMASQMN